MYIYILFYIINIYINRYKKCLETLKFQGFQGRGNHFAPSLLHLHHSYLKAKKREASYLEAPSLNLYFLHFINIIFFFTIFISFSHFFALQNGHILSAYNSSKASLFMIFAPPQLYITKKSFVKYKKELIKALSH